ncbi:MAG: sigma-70 family RNA polymerase sigma factor [Candidatus Poribacteria bacterium]|nr:sigma-70 family RNA polymerase sigma factor [Candidatus Poribacteria bacterium]MDE0505688.1 sigma-70 family RNA polymerase sigma factor [Candidatus Poribacteria bacterium]
MTNLADETLVERALAGDDTAFGLLVLRHQRDICQLSMHYVKNPADAQDLTQEVFVEAYTRLSTLQETSKFANWLCGITKNLSISWLRRQTHSLSYEEVMRDGEFEIQMTEILGIPKRLPTPDEALEQKELRQHVVNAIETLSEKNRLVTRLHYLDGMSYKEIAQHLNVPVSTIEGRLYRSRKQLKGEICMTKAVRDESKVEARLEEMRREIDDLRGRLQDLAGESDVFLGLKKGEALKTLCRLPIDTEKPIAWGYVGSYRPSPGDQNKRVAYWTGDIESFLSKASDTDIANLARIFTNPTAVAVLRQLVEGSKSVTDLAKESGISKSEIDKAVTSLVDAELVGRTEDNLIERKNDATSFFLTFVSMTVVHLGDTKGIPTDI